MEGKSPFSANAKVILGTPSILALRYPTTETSAPTDTKAAPPLPKTSRATSASGRSLCAGSGRIPTTTHWIAEYSKVQVISAVNKAKAASRRGFFASLSGVSAVSKPP